MVKSFVDDTSFGMEIKEVFKIDLTKISHKRVKRSDCKLHHTSEVADYFSHFVQEYGHHLEEADKILIERQPPGGLTNVEALILFTFRDKVELVSPNSMHKHFQINYLNYEKRKEKTIQISNNFLENFDEYEKLSRKHDIADAVCMLIFRFHKDKEKYRLSQVQKGLPFDSFILQKTQ